MKIKYNSFWSKLYKFTTGTTNVEISEDFFYYWFIVSISLVLLPITFITKIIEWVLPEAKWTLLIRVFTGLFLHAFIFCAALIVYTTELTGHAVIVWSVLFYTMLVLGFLYLIMIKFSFIGEKIIHVLYLVFKGLLWFITKLRVKPTIEFDKEDIYIIFDTSRYKGFELIEYKDWIKEMSYQEVVDNRLMHVVVPINECNIHEYLTNKYIVYHGIKYGNEIVKKNRIGR